MRNLVVPVIIGLVSVCAQVGSAAPLRFTPRLNTSAMADIDGHDLPAGANVAVRFRPWVSYDNGGVLELENFRVHDMVNAKAFHVSLSSPDRTPAGQAPWTYRKIYIHNVEAFNINRDERTAPGLHMDFLLIDGLGLQSPRETEIVIEDAYFHDGDALSTLIKAGRYSQVTLRRVRVERTTTPVQLGVIGDGYIRKVLVEDSPGLQVALMGTPGSIGSAIVRNSEGAQVTDARTYLGTSSGVHITYENGPVLKSVPEPASLGVLAIGAVMGLRRRRNAR